MICPRCAKECGEIPYRTCKASPLVAGLEQRIAALEAALRELVGASTEAYDGQRKRAAVIAARETLRREG
jgi:hypothetical protein